MTKQRAYDPRNKDQVFKALRQEILAARLKVTLDEQLGRTTPAEVKRLAQMKPPSVGRGYTGTATADEQADSSSRSGASGAWGVARPRVGGQERSIGKISGAHQATERTVERF